MKHTQTPFTQYKGLFVVECLNSRQNVQGYIVKRMPVDDYGLHQIPVTFETVVEAHAWIDTGYDPSQIKHRLTKEDKTIYILK